MNNIIAVIVAHPDDEVLGCGATIAKHARSGDIVHVLILAEGLTSRDKKQNRNKYTKKISKLAKEAHKANTIMGVSSLTIEGLPDNRLDSLDLLDIIKIIEKFIDRYKPERIYTHHAGDLNIDHQLIHQAVTTACRPLPDCSVNTLLFFEIASSTEWQLPNSAPSFEPNWFVEVNDTLDLKLQALDAYKTEIRNWPHPRSTKAIKHLARWRGATIANDAAEAFVLGRHIQIGKINI